MTILLPACTTRHLFSSKRSRARHFSRAKEAVLRSACVQNITHKIQSMTTTSAVSKRRKKERKKIRQILVKGKKEKRKTRGKEFLILFAGVYYAASFLEQEKPCTAFFSSEKGATKQAKLPVFFPCSEIVFLFFIYFVVANYCFFFFFFFFLFFNRVSPAFRACSTLAPPSSKKISPTSCSLWLETSWELCNITWRAPESTLPQ